MCVLSVSVSVCTHFCPVSWFHTHAYEMPYPQLNLYGFRKIQKGPDTGAYAHEHFLRDRPDELTYVRRMPQSAGTRPYPHMPNLEVAGVHHILAKVHHTHTSTGSPSPGGMSSSVSAGSLPSLSLSSFSPTPSPSASNRGLPKSSGNYPQVSVWMGEVEDVSLLEYYCHPHTHTHPHIRPHTNTVKASRASFRCRLEAGVAIIRGVATACSTRLGLRYGCRPRCLIEEPRDCALQELYEPAGCRHWQSVVARLRGLVKARFGA